MLKRLRQSLALSLLLQYALVFAFGAGLLFNGLYLWLARALEQRDQEVVEQHAVHFAETCQAGGVGALSRLINESLAPDIRSLFVRLISPDNTAVFVSAPPDWIETEVRRLPVPEWAGMMAEERRQTVRVPQDALRDYTIATHLLPKGWVLQVGRLSDSRSVLLAPLRRAFSWAAAATLLLSLPLGTLLAWRTTRPLRAVAITARRILDTGDLSARVPEPSGSGELALLVRQLNTLLDKNARHVRALRDTHDNLAHDLRTPLTRLRGAAELALQDIHDPDEAQAALADCINETDRLLHMLETLLDISSAENGTLRLRREQAPLRALLERSIALFQEVAEEHEVSLTLEAGPEMEASLDPVRFSQAINNLVDNAIKYSPRGGSVSLSLSASEQGTQIAITDSGEGVPEAEREAIFRRHYRRDSSRTQRGFGLGLSLVKAIVEAHGGTIRVVAAPSGAARFLLTLPAL